MLPTKIDLIKLISFIWMSGMAYMSYVIMRDLHYLTNLLHAYISLATEIARH